MDLRADMMGNQPHDALAVGCREALAGIRQATHQPVYPKSAVGIEHHLDDRCVFEPGRYRWSERGTQHARAPRHRFGLVGMNCHDETP
jgi:hypothetical protein